MDGRVLAHVCTHMQCLTFSCRILQTVSTPSRNACTHSHWHTRISADAQLGICNASAPQKHCCHYAECVSTPPLNNIISNASTHAEEPMHARLPHQTHGAPAGPACTGSLVKGGPAHFGPPLLPSPDSCRAQSASACHARPQPCCCQAHHCCLAPSSVALQAPAPLVRAVAAAAACWAGAQGRQACCVHLLRAQCVGCRETAPCCC